MPTKASTPKETAKPEAPVPEKEVPVSSTVIHPAKVNIDHTATFGCSTNISKPVRYIWMKNGVPVGGSHNEPSYSTPPVQPSHLAAADKYSVTVIGRDGTTETSAQVTLVMV